MLLEKQWKMKAWGHVLIFKYYKDMYFIPFVLSVTVFPYSHYHVTILIFHKYLALLRPEGKAQLHG